MNININININYLLFNLPSFVKVIKCVLIKIGTLRNNSSLRSTVDSASNILVDNSIYFLLSRFRLEPSFALCSRFIEGYR